MMHNATVEFDPSVTSTERLVDAIRATGYEAQVPPAAVAPSEARWAAAFAEQEAQERARGDELRELAWKAGVSLALGIVAMLISMPVMAAYAQSMPMSTADPFLHWLMTKINAPLAVAFPFLFATSPGLLAYLLLAMTTFVMVWCLVIVRTVKSSLQETIPRW